MLPEDARRSNRGLLLRALHHGGPASRADLAKLVGLTPATVSAVIKELLEAGLVDELGRTSRRRSASRRRWSASSPTARHIVTVSLSEPDQFVGALVNLAGKVVLRRTYERNDRTGSEALSLLGSICDDLVGDAERPLLGIGVATPGIVDTDGTVLRAARLGWSKVPLAARARRAAPASAVYVANDANASALAELTFGVAHSSDFLMVRVDQGVGVGLVLDGALYRGSRSASGEIGHVVVDPDGSLCTVRQAGLPGDRDLRTAARSPTRCRRVAPARSKSCAAPASGSAPPSPPCSARSTSAT